MKKKEKRMKSYVIRGNELIAKNKKQEAFRLVSDGLSYYSNNIISAISPYAMADAGLIVLALRHIADEVEAKNPGAKELAEGLDQCVTKPPLQEYTKVREPNCQ